MNIYIKGTKKEANQRLQEGREIWGYVYGYMSEDFKEINEMPSGTVVKFFKDKIGGTPIAKSYGQWKKEKNKIV